jgi:hypothetical protein
LQFACQSYKNEFGGKQFLIDPTGEVFRIKTLAGNLWSKIEQKAADLLVWIGLGLVA